MQKKDEIGGPDKNGFLRSLRKLDRNKFDKSTIEPPPKKEGLDGFLSQSFDLSAMGKTMSSGLNASMMSGGPTTARRGGSLLGSQMSATIDPEKAAARREKGLKICDDFFDLL